MPLVGSQFPVLSSWFPVLSSRFSVPGSQFPVLSSRFSGSWFSVPGSQFPVPGSWFLVPGSQFSVLHLPRHPRLAECRHLVENLARRLAERHAEHCAGPFAETHPEVEERHKIETGENRFMSPFD
jgi:hypothetical protein